MALTIGTMGAPPSRAAASGSARWVAAASATRHHQPLDRTGRSRALAKVTLGLNCGTVDLRGRRRAVGWSLHAATAATSPIDAGERQLTLRTHRPATAVRTGPWVSRPASLASLDLTANAATSTVDLGAAKVDEVNADVNAGDFRFAAARRR